MDSTTRSPRTDCEHPDGAIRSMAPAFPGQWSCTRCGQRFMPQNAAAPDAGLREALEYAVLALRDFGNPTESMVKEAIAKANAALAAHRSSDPSSAIGARESLLHWSRRAAPAGPAVDDDEV